MRPITEGSVPVPATCAVLDDWSGYLYQMRFSSGRLMLCGIARDCACAACAISDFISQCVTSAAATFPGASAIASLLQYRELRSCRSAFQDENSVGTSPLGAVEFWSAVSVRWNSTRSVPPSGSVASTRRNAPDPVVSPFVNVVVPYGVVIDTRKSSSAYANRDVMPMTSVIECKRPAASYVSVENRPKGSVTLVRSSGSDAS